MAQRGTEGVIALLGENSEFEGKLTFKGEVRIDGRFKGEVFSDASLVVGESGVVEGDVEIGTLIVHGRVSGTVKAKELIELRAGARVSGTLMTPALVMERGVIFDGQCQMSKTSAPVQPRTAATQPNVRPTAGA